MEKKLTSEQRERIRSEWATGKFTQRRLAELYAVSQPLISKIIASGPAPVVAPQVTQPVTEGPTPSTGRRDRVALGPIEDLEQRIRDLDQIAFDAKAAESWGPATQASVQASKLRARLDGLRAVEAKAAPRASADENDDDLMDLLVSAIQDLPDEAFERVEDAVARRRRVGEAE